jgi:hypothetical protein
MSDLQKQAENAAAAVAEQMRVAAVGGARTAEAATRGFLRRNIWALAGTALLGLGLALWAL